MKRCPRCNSVFEDSEVYCPNDGTPLAQETFILPSEVTPLDDGREEEETVVRHEPININIPNTTAPTEQISYQTPAGETVIPVVIEKPRNTGKYLLFLLLGLFLGGALVLATVVFAMYYFQNSPPAVANANAQNTPANTKTTPKTTPSPTETPVTASAKHAARTDASDDEFNGRVISKNAYVRFLPSRDSQEVDVLPVDDRLTIDDRASETSPWFHVTCEHGTSGWMHGNTIEYTH